MIHLQNGRAPKRTHTMGAGETWCGKKLLGESERTDDGTEVFISYGNRVEVSFDPERGTCSRCSEVFDAAYAATFPDGPKPIATFRTDNPADLARAKALLSPEALNGFFGPGGGGMSAYIAAVEAPTPENAGATQQPGEE